MLEKSISDQSSSMCFCGNCCSPRLEREDAFSVPLTRSALIHGYRGSVSSSVFLGYTQEIL